jgi:hypothetical protein
MSNIRPRLALDRELLTYDHHGLERRPTGGRAAPAPQIYYTLFNTAFSVTLEVNHA